MRLANGKRIADEISARGWACCEQFVTRELAVALRDEARASQAHGEFRAAAVGSGRRRAVRPEVRGDQTLWLTEPYAPAVQILVRELELLRLELNRTLTLGLFDLDLHFACYRPGSAYVRHFDQSGGDAARTLSLVLYLNDDWREEEGGALRLYFGEGAEASSKDLLPEAGRLVLFLSARFAHEVLPATRERLSVSGWFRRRESDGAGRALLAI